MFDAECAPPVDEPIPWVHPCEPNEIACASPDLDHDGDVDIVDFIELVMLWGPADCAVHKRGDINMDTVVGVNDLLILLQAWGVYQSSTWDKCNC